MSKGCLCFYMFSRDVRELRHRNRIRKKVSDNTDQTHRESAMTGAEPN